MAARFELGCDGPTTLVVGADGSSLEVAAELKPRIEALAADYHVTTTFVAVAGAPVL